MESGADAKSKLVRCQTCSSWTKAPFRLGCAARTDDAPIYLCRLCHLERRICSLEETLEAFLSACIHSQSDVAGKLSKIREVSCQNRDSAMPGTGPLEETRKVSLVRLLTLPSETMPDDSDFRVGNLSDGVSRWQKIKASISGHEVPSEDNPFVVQFGADVYACFDAPETAADEGRHARSSGGTTRPVDKSSGSLPDTTDDKKSTTADGAERKEMLAEPGPCPGTEALGTDGYESPQEATFPADGTEAATKRMPEEDLTHTLPSIPQPVKLKWKPLKFSIREVVRAPVPAVFPVAETSQAGGSSSENITGASVLSALLAKNSVRVAQDGTLQVSPKSGWTDAAPEPAGDDELASSPLQTNSASPRSPLMWKKVEYAPPKPSPPIDIRNPGAVQWHNRSRRVRSLIPRRKTDPQIGRWRSHSVGDYEST